MDELSQKNYLDFVKTTGKIADLYTEANNATQKQYQLGKLSVLEQAKKFLLNNSQYKYLPFSDMVHKLEKFIDGTSEPNVTDKKGLNLTGAGFKSRKKRGHKDEMANPDQQENNEAVLPELQKTKKET